MQENLFNDFIIQVLATLVSGILVGFYKHFRNHIKRFKIGWLFIFQLVLSFIVISSFGYAFFQYGQNNPSDLFTSSFYDLGCIVSLIITFSLLGIFVYDLNKDK